MLHPENMSELDLLRTYSEIIDELRKRGVVRTSNSPLGDYTEWLVATRLQLELSSNSTLGFDAIDGLGIRYQIKSRRSGAQLSAIRNAEQGLFDYLIAVIFMHDFSIERALKIPQKIVFQYARYVSHTNSHTLIINNAIASEKTVENITALLVDSPHAVRTNTYPVELKDIRQKMETKPDNHQRYLDRLLQTTGKTNFVLLCERILLGSTDDEFLMSLIPDTNKVGSKRSILAAARLLIQKGYTREVLMIICSSHLALSTIDKAKSILNNL